MPSWSQPTGQPPPPAGAPVESRNAAASDEVRNFLLLAGQQVVVRVGWIFKTESVIIPAFLDSIAGPGWMRGLLPVLSRIGQSVPAFLLSAPLQAMPRKKRALTLASFAMALPFLLLGGWIFRWSTDGAWLPAAFLALYLVFFGFSGLYQVALGTLQGKLIRPERRGRLISVAVFGSMVPAVTFAWWLLPGWLAGAQPAYDRIFLFTGVCFALAAGVAVALREERDDHRPARPGFGQQLRGAWEILRRDRNYRRAVVVAALFSSSIMIFPHYQALARERLGLAGGHMMLWVVVQNVSMGFASLLLGPIADRFGNRLALRLLVFAGAAIPIFVVGLTTLGPEKARHLFPLVFVGIGLVPIGFRVITNYLLEISPPDDSARYLSLSQLCTAASFLASPFFGLLIDVTSFELGLLLQAGLMAVGGVLTFGLVEPRVPRRSSRAHRS